MTRTQSPSELEQNSAKDVVLSTTKLPIGTPWPTRDPFLFCVHHLDTYPKGNNELGPAASLSGRQLGHDFAGRDGWRMYHGKIVPGFPCHPHRGFETVTVVRQGLLDHADSMGALARYGRGDVQWLTAGKGIQHSEMFPLLDANEPNTTELFQLWLNLPKAQKMVEPHFSMLWNNTIPTVAHTDPMGRSTTVRVIAGCFDNHMAPPPPPESWAADSDHDVAIWTLSMEEDATFTIPPSRAGTHRSLYVVSSSGLDIGGHKIGHYHRVDLAPTKPVCLHNGAAKTELLLLQGQPINEPISQYGPFVMNSAQEIRQAFADYQETGFGGWPWDRSDPVHGKTDERFARFAEGHTERPQTKIKSPVPE